MFDALRSNGNTLPGARAVYQILKDERPRTKAELVSITGLARTTVSARVDALLAAGLVKFAGEAVSTGGRPPSQVVANPFAGVVLAVDLGATHVTVALADLSGKILDSHPRRIDIRVPPAEILDLIIEDGKRLLKGLTAEAQGRLIGIGIGVPSPVKHSTGQPISPPIMPGWDRFDIPGYINRFFDVPVLVDNDANLLVLGEQSARWRDVTDLVFVKVATGIGAGIISGGTLQRGAQGSAGDIGHVQVPRSVDSVRPIDDERDLEQIASGPALAAELRSLGFDCANTSDLIELIRTNEPAAVAAMRQAGREIGEVLASVVNTLNPSVIVIGGSVARASEHMLAGIRETVYRRSIPLATQHLTIVQAQAGGTTAVRGAAIMVIERLLSAEQFESTLEQLARFSTRPSKGPHRD